MEPLKYCFDLPTGYTSWREFDLEIDKTIARPQQVKDIYWYMSAEGVGVITMAQLPNHDQLRFSRQDVRSQAALELMELRRHTTQYSTDLPSFFDSWREMLADIEANEQIPVDWEEVVFEYDGHDGIIGRSVVRRRQFFHRSLIMKRVDEERQKVTSFPFTGDEISMLIEPMYCSSYSMDPAYIALAARLRDIMREKRKAEMATRYKKPSVLISTNNSPYPNGKR